MKENKKIYLEIIRIFAIFMIIFNHIDGFIYFTVTENILTWLFSIFLASICKMGVPLFFMISGALLLPKEETYSELFRKRISRIIVVLLTVSFFYYIFDCWRYGIEEAGIVDFINKLCTNGIRESLWFLYTYLSMLLLLPFFRKMIILFDRKMLIYLLGLKVLYSTIIPFVSFFTKISIYHKPGFVDECFFYLILGYCMEEYKGVFEKNKKIWKEISKILVITSIDVAIMQIYYLRIGNYAFELLELFLCFSVIPTWRIGIMLADKCQGKDVAMKIISTIGGCVFGIYLLDNFVRWLLLPVYLWLTEKTVGVIACSVYMVLTFALGLLFTFVLKRIPILRKFL